MSIKKLLTLLSKREKAKALAIVGMMIVMGFLDMLGVASIMPFIAVLSNQEIIETNYILHRIYSILNFSNKSDFLIAMGIGSFLLLILSLGFKAMTTFQQIRFSMLQDYNLSKMLVDGYLNQSYSWFLNQNGANLGKNIISEVSSVTNEAILPLMNIIAQGSVTVAIILLLIVVNPILAFNVGAALVFFYLIVFYVFRKWIKHLGSQRAESNSDRFNVLNEAFGGIKEVKITGTERLYSKRFEMPAYLYAKSHSTAELISQLPRYMLEILAFGGLILILVIFISNGSPLGEVLPIVVLYAFSGYRLIPAVQQIYSSITKFKFAEKAIEILYADYKNIKKQSKYHRGPIIRLNSSIKLVNLNFIYPESSKNAIENVSLEIKAKTSVAFVGTTGSGKTTVVDLIAGLFLPTSGHILIDDTKMTISNTRNWLNSIAYVPQQIYLIDQTVLANIAYGVESKDIDIDKVIWAAKVAKAHDFIVTNMKDGYNTIVGERGVRLSGGQKQRIGIARALYREPQLLILDEATSALDSITEQELIDSIKGINNEITIIMIAHRLSTIRHCENIFLLENGEVKENGSYEQLEESSSLFASMIDKK
jgi:ABC-type multidrug transport system fused ATPase/permease subunit